MKRVLLVISLLALLIAPCFAQHVLSPAFGGTGLSNPGTAGNVLTSDGAGNWLSSAPSGGGGSGLNNVVLPGDAFGCSTTSGVETCTKQTLSAGYFWRGPQGQTTQAPTLGSVPNVCSVASATSITCPLNSAVQSGSIVNVVTFSASGYPSGVTDSASQTYTLAAYQGNNIAESDYYFQNSASGVTSVTVNFASATSITVVVMERQHPRW